MPQNKPAQPEPTPESHPPTAAEWETALEYYHGETRALISKAPALKRWTPSGPNPAGERILFDPGPEIVADEKQWNVLLGDLNKDDVYLSDSMVYAATHLLKPSERRNRFSNDFDSDGNIRTNRIPAGNTVVIEAHGCFFTPVYKGYYALTGRDLAEKYTWKVGTRHKVKHRGFNDRFGVGLMMYPGQDVPPGAWKRVMHYHDGPSTEPGSGGLVGYDKVEADAKKHDVWVVGRDGLVITFPGDPRYCVTALSGIPGVVDKCSGRDDASRLEQGKKSTVALDPRSRKRKRQKTQGTRSAASKKATSPSKPTSPIDSKDPEDPSTLGVLPRDLRSCDPVQPSSVEDRLPAMEEQLATIDNRLAKSEVRIGHAVSRLDTQESSVAEIIGELTRRVISLEERFAALNEQSDESE